MSEKSFNFITVMSHYIPKKKWSRKDIIEPYVLGPQRNVFIFILYIYIYIYIFFFFFFFNTIKCLGSGKQPR